MNSQQPHNKSTQQNPVGRFMVASGAVIEQGDTGKISLIQRSSTLDWLANEWEIVYGRIDQFEDSEMGLIREVREEVGILDLKIINVLTIWHMFRGTGQTAENELIGVTYHCKTQQLAPTLSAEHQSYQWVTPDEALDLVKIEGIKRDIKKFMSKNSLY